MFRIKEDASEAEEESAKDIIKGIKLLLNIAYNGEGNFDREIKAIALDEFDIDDVKDTYFYSQTFQIETRGEKFLRYRVKEKNKASVEYSVVNHETIEDKEEFEIYELIKIAVLNEEAKKTFKIEVDFEADCLIDKIYVQEAEIGTYLMYIQEEGREEFSVVVENIGTQDTEKPPEENEEPPIIKDDTEKNELEKLNKQLQEEINRLKRELEEERNLKNKFIEELRKEKEAKNKLKIEIQLKDKLIEELIEKLKSENKKEAIMETIYEQSKANEKEAKKDIEEMQILPRTGNDYFILKLIIVDIILFIIFLLIILVKSKIKNRLLIKKQSVN